MEKYIINGKEPYFIDEKKEFAWYINELLTKECSKGNLPVLKAICFDVYKIENNNLIPEERVLLSKKTKEILATDSSIEAMSTKITWLRTNKKIRRTKY